MKKFSLIFAILILKNFGFSQVDSLQYDIQEVVVTATKSKTEKSKIANPVYVITQEEIKSQPTATVGELLNQITGLHVQESYGNDGAPQQYSMRGGRAKDILILIDGMPISDDSHIQNLQDLNMVSTLDLERIEVQTGGATTYYGSNAAAGVINLITKGTSSPLVQAQVAMGKWNTTQANVQANLPVTDGLHAKVSFLTDRTDGFSAARDAESVGNFDLDGSKRNQFNAGLYFTPTDKWNINLTSSINTHDFDFDGGAFRDSQDEQENQQNRHRVNTRWENSLGDLNVAATLIDSDRKQYNPFGRSSDELYSQFESNQFQLDLFESFHVFNESHVVLGGYLKNTKTDQSGVDFFSGEYVKNLAKDSANFTLIEPYIGLQWNELDFVGVDVGGRLHTHSDYDNKLVYHIKPTFTLLNNQETLLQVKGAYSTSYNTPSLYQLYSAFGNQALSPEESTSYEGTLSATLFNQLNISSTYYKREEDNLLGFSNTTFRYANLEGESEAKGWENTISYNEKAWNASVFHASVKRDRVSDLYRLPDNEWGLNAAYSGIENLKLQTSFRNVAERVMPLYNSTTFMTDEFTMEPYQSWNVNASYALPRGVEVYGAVQNLLNDEIIDNLGYNWQERNVSVGARWTFEKN